MNRVRVSWTAPDNVLGYLIFHQLDGGSESQVNVEDPGATEHTIELTGEGQHTISMMVGGGVRELTVEDLVGDTQYNVTVSARNGVGYGPPSTGVLGTTFQAGE